MKPTAEEILKKHMVLCSKMPPNGYVEKRIALISMEAYAAAVKSEQPAEGAEEILKDNLNESMWIFINNYPVAHKANVVLKDWIIAAMQEFAALHAQKIADKIAEERMPTEEEDEKELLRNLHYVGSTITAYFINGWKSHGVWLRSRMEGGEK